MAARTDPKNAFCRRCRSESWAHGDRSAATFVGNTAYGAPNRGRPRSGANMGRAQRAGLDVLPELCEFGSANLTAGLDSINLEVASAAAESPWCAVSGVNCSGSNLRGMTPRSGRRFRWVWNHDRSGYVLTCSNMPLISAFYRVPIYGSESTALVGSSLPQGSDDLCSQGLHCNVGGHVGDDCRRFRYEDVARRVNFRNSLE
jgi:hypothetical protein